MTQDVVESIDLHAKRTMEVLWFGGMQREPVVEALEEPGQKRVAGLHIADVLKSEFFHQAILQRAVGSLNAALGLAGVRADDLDIQLGQGTAELCHAGATLRIRLIDSEDGVLVRVKGHRTSVGGKISLQRFEVRARTLTGDKAQLHQAARGIVDEDQQRAGLTATLEPAMLAAVDLHQFTPALTSQSGLMEASALLA